MSKLGIGGRFLGWTESFLKGRSFQVRIQNTLSSSYSLENGIAQGAQISPFLFIIMNNDITTRLTSVDSSLFADDLEIDTGGKNVKTIINKIQKSLDIIEEESDTWGLKISVEKTIGVLFTNSLTNIDITLKIYNKNIPIRTSAKFLGVTFDRELRFTMHIKDITNRCNRRLNLLRCLTGTTWGASPRFLLILYKTLILSVIDYGSIIYDIAPTRILQSIDNIQREALRIITGAMRGTAIDALQVITGQIPLDIRRTSIQLKYFITIESNPSHPCKMVYEDHWMNSYGKYTQHKNTLYNKLKSIPPNIIQKSCVQHRVISSTPPWRKKPLTINMDLKYTPKPKINTITNTDYEITNTLHNSSSSIHIFTGLSRDTNEKTGISTILYKQNKEMCSTSHRTSDGVSTDTAKLVAIKTGIEILEKTERENKDAIIFTDSEYIIKNLSTEEIIMDKLTNDIYEHITNSNRNITIIWIPSNADIKGKSRAEEEAEKGRINPTINLPIGDSLENARRKIQTHCNTIWQNKWDRGKTGRHYYNLEPTVNKQTKTIHKGN